MPLYIPNTTGASAVPSTVVAGDTYTVANNTQVPFANQLTTEATATVITVGTGALTWIN